MKWWLRRIRGALGMGLGWALGSAGIGGLFELIDNILPGALPFIARVDMWPQTLAIPGFVGGVVFSVVLVISGRHRRFADLSVARFAASGAVAGLLLGGLGMAAGAPLLFMGITMLASTIGASGSLVLARMAERRALLSADDMAEPRRFPGGAKQQLGDRERFKS